MRGATQQKLSAISIKPFSSAGVVVRAISAPKASRHANEAADGALDAAIVV